MSKAVIETLEPGDSLKVMREKSDRNARRLGTSSMNLDLNGVLTYEMYSSWWLPFCPEVFHGIAAMYLTRKVSRKWTRMCRALDEEKRILAKLKTSA